jgi:hypothetical protein
MRLFGIYNRAYKLRCVLAETIEEALTLATKAGHIKRPQGYRKWLDLTDNPPEDVKPHLPTLVAEGRAGVLVQDEKGWHLSS